MVIKNFFISVVDDVIVRYMTQSCRQHLDKKFNEENNPQHYNSNTTKLADNF